MEIFIVIISTFLLILGIAGSFLPVLPGPLLSWLGLFALNYSSNYQINTTTLVVSLVFTILITIADYIVPSKTAKKIWRKQICCNWHHSWLNTWLHITHTRRNDNRIIVRSIYWRNDKL